MYKKNYITKVIFRFDFVSPLESINPEYFPKLLDALKVEYTDMELNTQVIQALEFEFGNPQGKSKAEVVGFRGVFVFDNNKSKFSLEPGVLTLESDYYTKFDDFFGVFIKGFDRVVRDNEITQSKRLGLRFINKFKDEEITRIEDWSKYFDNIFIPDYDKIFKPFKELNFTLRRNMNDFFFNDGEFILHLKAGIWNDKFPSIITDSEFILDIDCYTTIISNVESITGKAKKMDHTVYTLFERIITDSLRKKMEKING